MLEPRSSVQINPELQHRRHAAAEASGGVTNDHFVYTRIEQIVREYKLSGQVLDYGAGKGHLTARLRDIRQFDQVSGADLMSRPGDLPSDIKWIELDLNEPLPVPNATYDLVVAAEVVEHLENPRSMARDIFRVLRPGGAAIVTTPNNESIRSLVSLLFRGHFVYFSDASYPAHITALLRQDIHRILTEAGFSHPRFFFTNHGGLPKVPTISWQSVSWGILKGRPFSDNILALAIKPE
jgi:2-polyprenyl-3-methyl-5-hydroxy-6-metoxy-1,4-benzoquinol methylase